MPFAATLSSPLEESASPPLPPPLPLAPRPPLGEPVHPSVTSTLPEESRVEVWPERAVSRLPLADQAPTCVYSGVAEAVMVGAVVLVKKLG
jgi:hypothetical protein